MLIGISGKLRTGKNSVARIIQGLDSSAPEDVIVHHVLNEQDFFGSSFQLKLFAAAIKNTVSNMTGIPVQDLEKEEVKDRILGPEWDRYVMVEFWNNDNGAGYDKYKYFATEDDMNSYIEFMEHTDETCRQIGKRHMAVRELMQEVGTDAVRDNVHPSSWVNALFAGYKSYSFKLQTGPIFPNWIITDVRFPNEMQAIADRAGITIRVLRDTKDPDNPKHGHASETALDNAEFDYVITNNGTVKDLINSVRDVLVKEKII